MAAARAARVRSRIAANKFRVTATSASWNVTYFERRGAKKIYEQTKNMSIQQRLEFWDERTRQLRSRQEQLRKKRTQQE